MRRISFHVVGIAREGMTGDVETERLLLLGEAVALRPFLLAEDALLGCFRPGLAAAAAEEPELAALAIALRRRSLRERRLDGVPERLARLPREIEGARRDQRLQRLAVDLASIDARAEIEEPRERLLARGEDSPDGA